MAVTAPLEIPSFPERPSFRRLPSMRSLFRGLYSNKFAMVASLFLILLAVAAIFAPWVAPHDPNAINIIDRLTPPVWQSGGSTSYLLGTDELGRDILSRIIWGARTSVSIGLVVVAFSVVLGTAAGLLAGYLGGWVDTLFMRIVDIQFSFPSLLISLSVVLVLGASATSVIIALCIDGWLVYCRLTRGMVMTLKHTSFLEAARVVGNTPRRVMLRHALPNILSPLITLATLEFARVVLAEVDDQLSGPRCPTAGGELGTHDEQRRGLPYGRVVADHISRLDAHPDGAERQRGGELAEGGRRSAAAERFAMTAVASMVSGDSAPYPVPVAPVLEVAGLTTSFETRAGRVRAVEDVSFSVAPGEIVGLVGESGSGKTVTSLSLLRLLPSSARTRGRVIFEGRDVMTLRGEQLRQLRGGRISMVFQDPMTSLDPVFTVGSQMIGALRAHQRISRPEALRRSASLLEQVGIPDVVTRLGQYPHELSGGMRQRVLIAMALSNEPALLIADEPTTALDVTIQAQILGLLKDINARTRMSIILVTHDLGVVAGLCDRVLVMYGGRLVEFGSSP